MAGLFSPKVPPTVPIVNPADTANRQNDSLARMLSQGGTNADTTGAGASGTSAPRLPTLTGLN